MHAKLDILVQLELSSCVRFSPFAYIYIALVQGSFLTFLDHANNCNL